MRRDKKLERNIRELNRWTAEWMEREGMERVSTGNGNAFVYQKKGTKIINRQTRTAGYENWIDRGDVTFFAAVRQHAIEQTKRFGKFDWRVECRCESEPSNIDSFEVHTSIEATILNPRKGS